MRASRTRNARKTCKPLGKRWRSAVVAVSWNASSGPTTSMMSIFGPGRWAEAHAAYSAAIRAGEFLLSGHQL